MDAFERVELHFLRPVKKKKTRELYVGIQVSLPYE